MKKQILTYQRKELDYSFDYFSLLNSKNTIYFETQSNSYNSAITRLANKPVLDISLLATNLVISIYSDYAKHIIDYLQVTFNGVKESNKVLFNKSEANNILDSILLFLPKSQSVGLYGLFSYEYITNYYPIIRAAKTISPDFRFQLYETYFLFDHQTKTAFVETLSDDSFFSEENKYSHEDLIIGDLVSTTNKEAFINKIFQLKNHFNAGDAYETVLARHFAVSLKGNPLDLFKSYKGLNPSPYMYYYHFEDEIIFGTSPEMMIKIEHNKVQTRPISGTAKRGQDLFEDYSLALELLNSEKEKSELDMLIDLARNDLAKICKHEPELKEYRTIEKYARVMHTVAHLIAELNDGVSLTEAYKATLNAGTLTGAPKISAMNIIAKLEDVARNYYGGAIGYLLADRVTDSAITIRTAFIKNDLLNYYSGVTVLLDSDANAEFEESEIKAKAFFETLNKIIFEQMELKI
jgi:anthranilate/para-aminobenzoate synthase component I